MTFIKTHISFLYLKGNQLVLAIIHQQISVYINISRPSMTCLKEDATVMQSPNNQSGVYVSHLNGTYDLLEFMCIRYAMSFIFLTHGRYLSGQVATVSGHHLPSMLTLVSVKWPVWSVSPQLTISLLRAKSQPWSATPCSLRPGIWRVQTQ